MGSTDPGKKDGNIQLSEYKSEFFFKRVEPLSRRLQRDFPDVKLDRKSVALLLGNILQFMEDALGKNALLPRPFPKLPATLFRDYSANGSAYAIAAKCYKAAARRGLDKIDWLNPAKRQQNLDILLELRSELQKQGKLMQPKIFIHPECKDADKLKAQVKEMKGSVASTAGSHGVTHIVYPFGPYGDPDDGQQYLRSLEMRDGQAFVHWWYMPDSYDEWISSGTAPEGLEPDHAAIGPWKVYVRWLNDSHMYNEWMNPIDYETEEFQEEQERFRKEAQDRADFGEVRDATEMEQEDQADSEIKEGPGGVAGPDTTAQVKRKREEDTSEGLAKAMGEEYKSEEGERESKRSKPEDVKPQLEVDPTAVERIAANVVKNKVLNPDRSTMEGAGTVEDISQGQQPLPIAGVPLSQQVPQAAPPQDGLQLSADVPSAPSVKKEMYKVPAYACWFEWNKISDLERQLVPEFFNGRSASKTPKTYKDYRAFIINKYRENPERRLTFTEIRKLLAGDVNGIYRVFNFLDIWGLINYMARDTPRENAQVEVLCPSGGPIPAKLSNNKAGAPATSSLFHFSKVSPLEGADAGGKGFNGSFNLITRKNHFGGTAKDPSTAPVQFRCTAMPWVDCTSLRYHCTTIPDVDLCPQAYAEGRFPPGTSAKDFVRIDQSSTQPNADGWSNQETLLLLEALELYSDNWTEVAEHVGTKSQLQCIMHFLQMPIEDQFMDQMASGSTYSILEDADKEKRDSEEEEAIPFADANNPVMAQVAFLAAMVGPKVAAAAAQRALEVLSEDDPGLKGRSNGAPADSSGNPERVSQGKQTEGEAQGNGVSAAKMRVAAATALSAAAVKAKLMAEQEEREIQRLVVSVVDSQLKKLEIKLKYSEDLDKALEQERLNLQAARQKVDADRQQLRNLVHKAAAAQQPRAPEPAQAQPQQGLVPQATTPLPLPASASTAQAAQGLTDIEAIPPAGKPMVMEGGIASSVSTALWSDPMTGIGTPEVAVIPDDLLIHSQPLLSPPSSTPLPKET